MVFNIRGDDADNGPALHCIIHVCPGQGFTAGAATSEKQMQVMLERDNITAVKDHQQKHLPELRASLDRLEATASKFKGLSGASASSSSSSSSAAAAASLQGPCAAEQQAVTECYKSLSPSNADALQCGSSVDRFVECTRAIKASA